MLGARRDRVGGQLDAGVGVDPPPRRRGDRVGAVERVAAGVGEEVAQRAARLADRIVERRCTPSSTAMRTAHAVSILVSDASRNGRSVSPTAPSTVPSAATTAAAAFGTGHVGRRSSAATHGRRQSGVPVISSATSEGEVEALAAVEARVAHRLVAVVEVGVGHRVGAAEALGDVLAGELDVDAAGPRALGAVGAHEAGDLADDVVEVAGLAAVRAC